MNITRTTTGKRTVRTVLVDEPEWWPGVGWSLVYDPANIVTPRFTVSLGRDKDERAVFLSMTLAEAELLLERLAAKVASGKARAAEYTANPGHVATTSET